MIDKQQVKLHFSKNASNYDQYANVQKKMGDILIEFIEKNKKDDVKIENILEIGCGTGYLTGVLTELFPSARITAVDIAPGMIVEIKHKFKNNSIDFVCADIEEIELKGTYDLIISNAAFQWFNYLPATIKKLYNALNAKGILCFSTFGKHTFHELNECFEKAKETIDVIQPVSSGQYFYSLDELDAICKDAVGNEINSDEISLQNTEIFEYEYFNNCRDFFYSIKKIGASNSNKDNKPASPAFIRKVIELYNENFREDNKVKASYHCLFYKIIK